MLPNDPIKTLYVTVTETEYRAAQTHKNTATELFQMHHITINNTNI